MTERASDGASFEISVLSLFGNRWTHTNEKIRSAPKLDLRYLANISSLFAGDERATGGLGYLDWAYVLYLCSSERTVSR